MTMQGKDVPEKWIKEATRGFLPVVPAEVTARTFLANAYDTIREDLLWELVDRDVTVTCACGMEWFLIPNQGPDPGHGRAHCESGAPATVRMNGHDYQLEHWTLTPTTGLKLAPPQWQLGGWWRNYARDKSIYGAVRLEAADLPGRACPVGHMVHVEMTGYGDGNGLFVKIWWDRDE